LSEHGDALVFSRRGDALVLSGCGDALVLSGCEDALVLSECGDVSELSENEGRVVAVSEFIPKLDHNWNGLCVVVPIRYIDFSYDVFLTLSDCK